MKLARLIVILLAVAGFVLAAVHCSCPNRGFASPDECVNAFYDAVLDKNPHEVRHRAARLTDQTTCCRDKQDLQAFAHYA